MPLLINLSKLERQDLVLEGELTAAELDLEQVDELVRLAAPLEHSLTAQKLDDAVLVMGSLHVELECECGRCLKKYPQAMDFPNWAVHLPLEGEEMVSIKDDCIDLTPFLREDILLELPQRPLCRPDCPGLPKTEIAKLNKDAQNGQDEAKETAWSELDKLKF